MQNHYQQALNLIANDDSQGNKIIQLLKILCEDIFHILEHDALFFMIYEKIPVHAGDLQPGMWRYRARITLEHLAHALQQNADKSLVILKEFLRLVSTIIV